MEDRPAELMIDVHQLRLGMFVVLDLGWMGHPFPRSRFKIRSAEQLHQLRGLRLKTVRVLREQSDPEAFDALPSPPSEAPAPSFVQVNNSPLPSPELDASAVLAAQNTLKRQILELQNASLARCEKQFGAASAAWKQIASLSLREPLVALQRSTEVVGGFMDELSGTREVSIRLLSEAAGDAGALHALNVTVISLLLGRAMKFDEATLHDIGLGALLHDIGKQALPERMRWKSDQFTAAEDRSFRDHVLQGVQIAKRMGLTEGAQRVIAQHHETADAKGYPLGAGGDEISDAAKVVSLVNGYDNLCNPGVSSSAATPHEALSLMFAQIKPRFDPACLTAFIRLMGVYPPGSIVQLRDDRFALVVSVNAARPLKPTVIVFDAKVPRDEAVLLDLQSNVKLGIRRSLHPRHLEPSALAYLAPSKRNSYFFEQNNEATEINSGTAWVMDGGGPGHGAGMASDTGE